jgi:hypothetical protein
MPCYEAPMPHEKRLPEFLAAALCYATSKMTPEDIAGFPGLAEWRKRHDYIDSTANGSKYAAAAAYDPKGWGPPEFMKQFMAAYPTPADG